MSLFGMTVLQLVFLETELHYTISIFEAIVGVGAKIFKLRHPEQHSGEGSAFRPSTTRDSLPFL